MLQQGRGRVLAAGLGLALVVLVAVGLTRNEPGEVSELAVADPTDAEATPNSTTDAAADGAAGGLPDPEPLTIEVAPQGSSVAGAPTTTTVGTGADGEVQAASNGQLVLEAESAVPAGAWQRFEIGAETVMLWDSTDRTLSVDSVRAPVEGQTLAYRFRTDEAATYQIAMFGARVKSVIDEPQAGGDPSGFGDTRDNDVYLSVVEADTNREVLAPTRVFSGMRASADQKLRWGNRLDPTNGGPESWTQTRPSQVELAAGSTYELRVTGRSDGFAVDKLTVRSDTHLRNTGAHRAPPGGEAPPQVPYPSPGQVDLGQYEDMAAWSEAGVQGGIPAGLATVKTIAPGDDIQRAVDEVHDRGGGVLVLSNGTHEVARGIVLKSGVVLRGQDRNATRIESRVTEGCTVTFDKTERAGIENLTMNYRTPEGGTPELGSYKNLADESTRRCHVLMQGAKNNWVRGADILNAGADPVNIERSSSYNTMTGNLVQGAYNKGGGTGYYRITGKHNLVRGERVKDVRHFGILTPGKYNVVVDSYFNTDINYHSGDDGHNLFEANTVDLPDHHGWLAIGTGGPSFGHMPPGGDNLVVNNLTRQAPKYDVRSPVSEKDVVYTFEGYGYPVATNIPIPEGGRFYVPAWG